MITPLSCLRSRARALVLFAVALLPLAAGAVDLVQHGAPWRYRRGTNAPPVGWQTLPDASLDASWETGTGGIGYGDGDDATVLADMPGHYTTVYLRASFTTDGSIGGPGCVDSEVGLG